MKVFLAGATGVIGRPLIAQLIAANHDVVGMTRSDGRTAQLKSLGATPVVCDVFDEVSLMHAMQAARPDVVINQVTAFPKRIDPRKIATQLGETNRLRKKATEALLRASQAAGAMRFLSQSIAFAYDTASYEPADEGRALLSHPPASFSETLDAIRRLEETTLSSTDLTGIVLRYGFLYGPGTAYAADGSFAEDVMRKGVPVIGGGNGVFSFIHVDDAAAATIAAMEAGEAGVYNIVDDEPAAVRDWLPYYARELGAAVPPRIPRWLAHIVAGPYGTYIMCDQRGASNAKAKRDLGWSPKIATWRLGFRSVTQEQMAEA